MTTSAYANLLPQMLAGHVSLPGDACNMGLLSSAYTPNFVTDVHWTDISGHEISGSGYTAGGVALTGQSLPLTAANSWANIWAAGHIYSYGDVVRPSAVNGNIYVCVVAGTSGGTAPAFPTTVGLPIVDNTVTWVCLGGWASVFTSNPAFWGAASFTANYGAVYDTVSGVLIALQDFGGGLAPVGQPFQVSPHPSTGWVMFPPL